jgi:iron complex outermembrane recepter protein
MITVGDIVRAKLLSPDRVASTYGAHPSSRANKNVIRMDAVSSAEGGVVDRARTRKLGFREAVVNRRKCRSWRPLPWAAVLALIATAPTFAQTQTASDKAEPIQEVIVTGSRIPQPNMTATSPIQVVTSQEIKQQGYTDAIDLLNSLPQNFQQSAVDLSNTSNPLGAAGGITTADLRGLGPQRTLVLVDGRRLGPGDPNTLNPNPAPDLDQIPVSLIERVDVVTGGASAVYGSDAIAGVVNFIMKKNFEGIEVNGQLGVDQHSNHSDYAQNLATAGGFPTATGSTHDGQSKDFSLLMGTNIADGKGNITAYLEYRHALPVFNKNRDFAACEIQVNSDSAGNPTPNHCIGSPNSNIFIPSDGNPYSVVGNQLLPYPQAGSSPPPEFNSNAYLSLSREDERYNAGFMSHIDINDSVKPYMDFSFMNDKSTTETAPSGLFFPGGNATTASLPGVGGQNYTNCSNPLLSAQELALLCASPITVNGQPQGVVDIGRRNIEGGPRIAYNEHTNYRVVVGLKGEPLPGWSYDAYGQYYYTTLFNANNGYVDYAKVDNALQVGGTAADPVCLSGSPCVPYNIWTQGGVTPAQTAYLQSPGTGYGSVTERILHGDVTGDLGQYGVKSPLASDGLGVNVGFEHRSDTLAWDPDEGELAGNLAGFSGAVVPIHAGYNVSEGFAEARLPIASNLPFVRDLNFDAGYRYSKYSTAGHTNAYKFEVQYAPIDDARLRASFERAIRAPNLIELFNPPSYGQQGFLGVDPCAGASPTASFAQCANTGVTAAQYGHIPQCAAGQCGQILGGNEALKPEVANTYDIGLTLNPTMLPGFTASVDYYNIDIKNEISTIPGAYLFNQCLNSGQFCNDVVRSTISGALTGATVAGGGYIVQTSQNIAEVIFRGIDVQGAYRYALPGPWGSIAANFNGSYLLKSITTPAPGLHGFDCAGLFGPNCFITINPKWRHNMRVSWDTPFRTVFSVQWRFIGKVGLDNNDPDPSLFGGSLGGIDPYNAHLPNMSYIDLSAIYSVTDRISVRAGVNNVLDKDPPLIPAAYINGAGSANAYPTYDLVGRQVFVGFTAKF